MFKLAPSKEINVVAHSSLKQVNIETAQREQISPLLPFLKKNVKTFFVLHTFYFFFFIPIKFQCYPPVVTGTEFF